MGTGEMEVYGLWVQIGCNFEMYKNKKPCKCYRCACKAFLYTYKKKRIHYILDINTIALIYQITIVLNKKR